MTPTEFLLARIAEDEALADRSVQLQLRAGAGLVSFGAPDSPLILIHTPARVLAECAAKRRIVEEHAPRVTGGCGVCRGARNRPMPHPCWTLLSLALPYADHPDYQEEWKP